MHILHGRKTLNAMGAENTQNVETKQQYDETSYSCPNLATNHTVDVFHRTVEFALLSEPGNKSYGGVVFYEKRKQIILFS